MKRGLDTSTLAKGTTKTTVRAYTASADGKKTNEVVGAKCKIESDELLAEVVTPQVVVLPKFKQRAELDNRGLPSSLIATCKADKLSGALCQLTSPQINAAVTSPRAVSMPTYAQGARFKNRGAPAPVKVSCRAGDLRGSATLIPEPIGAQNQYRSGASTSGQVSTGIETLNKRMHSAYPWGFSGGLAVELK